MAATTPIQDSPAPRGVRLGVLRDLAAGFVLALATAAATWWLLGGPTSLLVLAVGLNLAMSALIALRAPQDLPGPGLGAANRITLLRAALATPVGALALRPVPLGPGAYWWIIGLSTLVLVLDGVDGRVARTTGTSTAFGARFDMELDAALILALSALAAASGKVGVWVLLIGLMRYLFVAASWLWPALAAELPDSFRRKWICVAQGVVLLVVLGPIIPTGPANAVAAASLILLTYSFAVDVRWSLAQTG